MDNFPAFSHFELPHIQLIKEEDAKKHLCVLHEQLVESADKNCITSKCSDWYYSPDEGAGFCGAAR